MPMRAVVASVCLFGTVLGAGSQTLDCSAIKDDSGRLACYDASNRPAKPASAPNSTISSPIPAAMVALSPAFRRRYATHFERAFLSNGIDLSVYPLEEFKAGDRAHDPVKKFPRLVVFGYLSRPIIFKLVAETNFLKDTKDAGFRSIEFFGKFDTHGYYFDLSGAELPKCDTSGRICL